MSEAHFWLLLLLAMFAWPGAAYVFRYMKSSPEHLEITAPREDLSWRTSKAFLIAVGSLLAITGVAAYSFTTQASEFARSQSFMILLCAGLAGFGGYSVFQGIRTGNVEPAMKGSFGPYSRRNEPRRYWLSMTWNTILTLLMAWFATMAWNGDF